MIRDGLINCHVYMRSSDAWMGVPYDWFNFSMMTRFVAYNYYLLTGTSLGFDTLHFTAASAHLYENHYAEARKMVTEMPVISTKVPFTARQWPECASRLLLCRDGKERRPF
jgi:thymidylate synthase